MADKEMRDIRDGSIVTAEDIGEAEQVVQRLLHERRSLENIQKVLMTYREASAMLVDVNNHVREKQAEFERLTSEVEKLRENSKQTLASVNATIKERVAKAEEELHSKLEKTNAELITVNTRVEKSKQEHQRVLKMQKTEADELDAELEKKTALLNEIKRQHEEVVATLRKMQL